MKIISVEANDLSVDNILSDWEKADSEEKKMVAAAMADAMLTANKDGLTSIEKAKLLQAAAYLDNYSIKKLVVDKTLGEETAIRTTEFISDMCELSDKYKIDRDKHIKNIATSLARLCAEGSFKNLEKNSTGGCDA